MLIFTVAREHKFIESFLQIKYTGKSISEKVEAVRKKMVEEKVSALVVEALDEVACKF